MSTASPDTWGDVSEVATHRAASSSEPYFETASSRSCSSYAGERQPLLTKSSTPSSTASAAARRRAPRRAGSSLATPGISSSKTVVPSGTAPSASPNAPPRSDRLDVVLGERGLDDFRGGEAVRRTSIGAAAVEDEDATNW